VDPLLITSGFYGGVTESPQAYLYRQIGAEPIRTYYADWAAHNTGGYDYLTPEQVARADRELRDYGDANNIQPFVLELEDGGTNGESVRPPEALTARGWAYNVVRISNSDAATYAFTLAGDAAGSEGAPAVFEGRIVVMGEDGPRYSSLSMTDARNGTGEVAVTGADSELFLVIASVPEHFGGNQWRIRRCPCCTYVWGFAISAAQTLPPPVCSPTRDDFELVGQAC
jgi:hypothetical protein